MFGDVAIGRKPGELQIQRSWLPNGITAEQMVEGVWPLLELPIELVLPTHGDPIVGDAHEALSAALAA